MSIGLVSGRHVYGERSDEAFRQAIRLAVLQDGRCHFSRYCVPRNFYGGMILFPLVIAPVIHPSENSFEGRLWFHIVSIFRYREEALVFLTGRVVLPLRHL